MYDSYYFVQCERLIVVALRCPRYLILQRISNLTTSRELFSRTTGLIIMLLYHRETRYPFAGRAKLAKRKRHFYFSAAFRYLIPPPGSNARYKYKKKDSRRDFATLDIRSPSRAAALPHVPTGVSHESVMEHPNPPTRCANVTTNHLISDQVPIITFLVLPACNVAVPTSHITLRVRSAIDPCFFLGRKKSIFISAYIK